MARQGKLVYVAGQAEGQSNKPLRLRIVDEDRDTTTGPRVGASVAPQFKGMGSIPFCLGYVLELALLVRTGGRVCGRENSSYVRTMRDVKPACWAWSAAVVVGEVGSATDPVAVPGRSRSMSDDLVVMSEAGTVVFPTI